MLQSMAQLPERAWAESRQVPRKVTSTKSDHGAKLAHRIYIALDLPVILGITFLAVATTLQRGVADYNLILTVIVLLTTTGLVTHITNVLRLMHLQTQANSPMRRVKSRMIRIKCIVSDTIALSSA
jgi:hypothetical protein